MTNRLKAALEYIDQGFSVIPCGVDKKPLTLWTEYQNRRATETEVRGWFQRWPDMNIGIVTGTISGLAAIDADSPAAVKWCEENLSKTPTVTTGRGRHYYCRYIPGVRNQVDINGLKLDLRGSAGYIIAPPSIHESGVIYEWVKGKELEALPLAELPDIVLAKGLRGKTPVKKLLGGVSEGARNDSLTRIAGTFFALGHDFDETVNACLEWNEQNSPPMPEKEVRDTVKSIHSTDLRNNRDKPADTSQSEKLLQLAEPLCLFRDQQKEGFVFLENEAVSIRSRKLKQWLAHKLYTAESKAPNSDALIQALNVLEAKAVFDGLQEKLHNRVAEHDRAFWYDLGDDKSVRVSTEGWGVVNSPILFRRYSHQQVQSTPVTGGDPYRVFKFLNVDTEHQLLVLVYIVSCFVPEIPHPIFHPHGPQGAGKTSLCRIIKKLCDPSEIETLIAPKGQSELVQTISHHHVCIFDNLSDLSSRMSDLLAQACTGGGFSKRQLYTDDEDVIYHVKRCIGLNGINLLISKPDLMDRSILLYLERIDPSTRIEEAKLWSSFDEAKPEILGGIFDTLSKAIVIYPSVKLSTLPRMADFAKWGYAIAEALGVGGNEFLIAYQKNIERQNEEVIQNNSLAQAVLTLMSERDSWDGTIKEAWEALSEIAPPDKADPTFPLSARSLRKDLEKIKSNLIDYGISYRIGRKTRNGYPIAFQKSGEFSSLGSQASIYPKNKDFLCEANVNENDAGDSSSQGNSLKNKDNALSEASEPKSPTGGELREVDI